MKAFFSNKIRCAVLCVWGLLSVSTFGQTPTDSTAATSADVRAAYEDSLQLLRERFAQWHYAGADSLSNPYYAPLFAGSTFAGQNIGRLIGQLDYRVGDGLAKPTFAGPNAKVRARQWATDRALARAYTHVPRVVRRNLADAPMDPRMAGNETPAPLPIPVAVPKPADKLPEPVEPDWEIEVRKPNFWTYKADFAFQLMQTYVSDNWYKGGESNHAFLATLVAQANYDNKTKLTFNNKLELKFGMQSSGSDEIHRYKSTEDLIRLTNELGIKATTHWSYSAMLQSWTQFWYGYKKNDETIYSDFMSPFESLFTLGMKYSYSSKNKKFTTAVNISPFASDFKYCARPSIRTRHIGEDKSTKFEFGSNITATYTWQLHKNIKWTGRFYYYTNYHHTTIEWENTLNLQVSKFLSTQLFLYPRFDDTSALGEDESTHFQFKEYLSVGFAYSL